MAGNNTTPNMCYLFPDNPSQCRLILYLSISAAFMCISYLMGELHPDGVLCDFQAWWMTFFDWSVLLWVVCITFNLYMNAVLGKITEKYEWLYHLVCWSTSLLFSCLPFIGDHYGPAGAWCWIKDDWQWRVGIWYGPLIALILLMFVVYVYMSCTLNRRVARWEGMYDPDTERSKQLLRDDIKPLRAYPFVYLAVTIFPLVNRIQNAIDPSHAVFPLVLLASITVPLHGALNALVFGMDRETLKRLTPLHIKMAFQSHFERGAEIHEFPSEEVTEN
ncbi:hypothetical protein CHS0354_034987 [Potamilus streckersoni]|uniref:G-protein coupled receptors family 2 profile 2 domain-containing protein n=1 Tax=Potamilus streckersoni TaxID=2493646 RepID=A0AAE0SDR1_9BIVA|nr:hypothetical protein CHS0354_034987 [Potamilus streckersoni]